MTKIENMTIEEIKENLFNVRQDIQYLGEKLDRKRRYRDSLLWRMRQIEKESE